MTSPYASSLLQRPVTDEERDTPTPPPAAPGLPPAPRRELAVRQPPQAPQVVHVPVHVPQPVPVVEQRGSRISALMLGIVVVLLGAVAAVGGWAIGEATAPEPGLALRAETVASGQAFRTGRLQGIAEGRQYATTTFGNAAAARAAAARQASYTSGFNAGRRDGEQSYQPYRIPTASRGYSSPGVSYSLAGSGLGGYWSGGGDGWGTWIDAGTGGPIGGAQALADATGQPVDVVIG